MRRRSSGSSVGDSDDNPEPRPIDANLTSFPDGPGANQQSDDPAISETTSRPNPKKSLRQELDRRKSTDKRPATARSRRPSNTNWKPAQAPNGSLEEHKALQSAVISVPSVQATGIDKMVDSRLHTRRSRFRSPWSTSLLTLVTTAFAIISIFTISHSFLTRQLDSKGCHQSWMRPSYAKLEDFDTEHTRFASKYSIYLYREQLVDEDTKACYSIYIII